MDTTIDLRGERVEDGIFLLDQGIDDAVVAGQEVVTVVHGHGSGELRKAVRSHLRGHARLRDSRAGINREGGEGVTIIWIRD